ncbi:unnamed protein product [marine sediment metagenome]|uniref:Holin n=1 Tax=marine sediment metagenome TaxID=412755 RepID=X1MKW9_9ZZZZ
MTDIELLLLLASAIFGALLSAGLGWAESGSPFDARKFWPSLVRAAISAVVVFVGTSYAHVGPITAIIYIFAFLTGMGIDAGGNRIAGAIRIKE